MSQELVVESGDHSGGDGATLVGINVAVAHDGVADVVAMKADEGDVTLVEQRELDRPMPEPMNVVPGGVETHVGEPGMEPPVELSLDERRPGTVLARELEDVVVRPNIAATHQEEPVQCSNRAEDGAWGGHEMYLVEPFPELNCFGEDDSDDDTSLYTADFVPSEVPHRVSSGRVTREEVAAA